MWTHRPLSGGAPSLVKRGKFFAQENGERWTGVMSTDFSLPKRFLMGEDVRRVLDDRASLGFNELRQWLLNESVVGQIYPGGISPKQHGDFYARLRALWELCGSYGFAVEATAFTSCVPIMTNRDDQIHHWLGTQDAAQGLKNVRLELVNEYDWGHGENAPHRDLWSMRPAGIMSSSGSSTADAPPSTPVWDYVLYHSNDLDQWQRKVGHNAMEWGDTYNCPAASNENTRMPDHDNSEAHAYDAAAGAALLCASSCFHSQGGKYSTIFSPDERRLATKWVEGAKSVPLEFQDGRYIHRNDLEDSSVIRAYERRLNDGRGHIVLIRG